MAALPMAVRTTEYEEPQLSNLSEPFVINNNDMNIRGLGILPPSEGTTAYIHEAEQRPRTQSTSLSGAPLPFGNSAASIPSPAALATSSTQPSALTPTFAFEYVLERDVMVEQRQFQQQTHHIHPAQAQIQRAAHSHQLEQKRHDHLSEYYHRRQQHQLPSSSQDEWGLDQHMEIDEITTESQPLTERNEKMQSMQRMARNILVQRGYDGDEILSTARAGQDTQNVLWSSQPTISDSLPSSASLSTMPIHSASTSLPSPATSTFLPTPAHVSEASTTTKLKELPPDAEELLDVFFQDTTAISNVQRSIVMLLLGSILGGSITRDIFERVGYRVRQVMHGMNDTHVGQAGTGARPWQVVEMLQLQRSDDGSISLPEAVYQSRLWMYWSLFINDTKNMLYYGWVPEVDPFETLPSFPSFQGLSMINNPVLPTTEIMKRGKRRLSPPLPEDGHSRWTEDQQAVRPSGGSSSSSRSSNGSSGSSSRDATNIQFETSNIEMSWIEQYNGNFAIIQPPAISSLYEMLMLQGMGRWPMDREQAEKMRSPSLDLAAYERYMARMQKWLETDVDLTDGGTFSRQLTIFEIRLWMLGRRVSQYIASKRTRDKRVAKESVMSTCSNEGTVSPAAAAAVTTRKTTTTTTTTTTVATAPTNLCATGSARNATACPSSTVASLGSTLSPRSSLSSSTSSSSSVPTEARWKSDSRWSQNAWANDDELQTLQSELIQWEQSLPDHFRFRMDFDHPDINHKVNGKIGLSQKGIQNVNGTGLFRDSSNVVA
ncbi:hypothetical protein BGW41_000609 [Actinomortierella wolfii]|nr:hypothetical protein BGW41_000609 [Actinomortierella wolfii]